MQQTVCGLYSIAGWLLLFEESSARAIAYENMIRSRSDFRVDDITASEKVAISRVQAINCDLLFPHWKPKHAPENRTRCAMEYRKQIVWKSEQQSLTISLIKSQLILLK